MNKNNYQWKKWLSGEPYYAIPKRDFNTTLKVFKTAIYRMAKKHGKRAIFNQIDKGVVLELVQR